MREARGHDLAWAGVSELPPDELVHALLSTVGCVDRGAHRAAHTALQRALQRDGTQPALVSEALLTALRRVSGRALGQQPAHAALRWTALLAPHVDPSTPLFACLAGVQSVLLLTLTTGKPRGRRCATRHAPLADMSARDRICRQSRRIDAHLRSRCRP